MKYDVAIIGGGPSGISAGVYTSRAGLKTILFEKLVVGGQASISYSIENFIGFPQISGAELSEKLNNHALSAGVEIEYEDVKSLTKSKSGFELSTDSRTIEVKKVIIACGCKTKSLGLEKENELVGKGISYCATCDGNFFKGKVVGIVGGGRTAFGDAKYLSKIAKKVYLFVRSETFKVDKTEVAEVKKIKNVQILTSTKVKKLISKDVLTGVQIETSQKLKQIKLSGLFLAIGYEPNLNFLKFKLKKDKQGYLIVNDKQETSCKNLYACGDITSKSFKQIVTACSDGAKAGNSCIGE